MSKSPERIAFETELRKFAASLKPESIVYDIGKSQVHDYRSWFEGQRYRTIDCNPAAGADIIADIEGDDLPSACTALVCNGVAEQCGDVAAMLRGCRSLISLSGGVALFGIIGPGYPLMQGMDRVRLTPQGVRHYLTAAGFRIKDIVPVERGGVPSYSLVWCEV